MHHLITEYWVFLAVGAFLLIAFYACLCIAGRESEQESRFEAQWDLEHEAADVCENQADGVHPMQATFHARPSF
jgi:hypothetical protein